MGYIDGESGLRDVGRLVVPATGAVVEAPGDRVLPVRLVGADGAEVAAVTEFALSTATYRAGRVAAEVGCLTAAQAGLAVVSGR